MNLSISDNKKQREFIEGAFFRECVMRKRIGICLFVGLMISSPNFGASINPTEMEQVALTFKELAYYFGAAVPFHAVLRAFDQKNFMNPAEITCKFCPTRSLPCGELIVKVQAKAMDKAIGAQVSISDEVRKKMLAEYHEITKLLCIGSIDDIRKFMAKLAQDNIIPCEDCQRSDWQSTGVSECTR